MKVALDLAIIASSAVSFMVFFCLQVVVFRLVPQEAVLKWIMNIFAMASVLHFVFLTVFIGYNQPSYPGGIFLLSVVSYFLFGLAAFVYILCIFGPSETSIRIRVVRELGDLKGSRLAHEELLKRYNGQAILRRRIERLKLAGEIIEKDGRYLLLNKSNAFFMIDAVALLLQKMLRKS